MVMAIPEKVRGENRCSFDNPDIFEEVNDIFVCGTDH